MNNRWKAISYWIIVALVMATSILAGFLAEAKTNNDYLQGVIDYQGWQIDSLVRNHSEEVNFYKSQIGSLRKESQERAERIGELAQEKNALVQKVHELEEAKSPFIPNRDKDFIGTVNRGELFRVLTEYYPYAQIKLWDNSYRLVSVETLRAFLGRDNTSSLAYIQSDGIVSQSIAEYLDCDETAFRLKGNAVKAGIPALGLVEGIRQTSMGWTGNHALNLFVTKEGTRIVIYEIESRTGEVERVEGPVYETFFIII